MKLLLIRHGDPDYELDNLTPAGKLEAQYLAERIAPMPVTQYYLSPLGRAQATAAPTLKAAGREGVTFDWLQEFSIPVDRPDLEGMSTVPWDWLPQDWLADPRLRSPEHWKENEVFQKAHVGEEYDKVVNAFDALLAEHGYERDGELYRVRRANTETLVFFCHLGVACVIFLRDFEPSALLLAHEPLAQCGAAADLRHHSQFRGAPPRHRHLPRQCDRRYFPSLRAPDRALLCLPLLRDLRQRRSDRLNQLRMGFAIEDSRLSQRAMARFNV